MRKDLHGLTLSTNSGTAVDAFDRATLAYLRTAPMPAAISAPRSRPIPTSHWAMWCAATSTC